MAKMRTMAAVFQKLAMLRADARGVAAIEFAFTGLMLVLGLLNAVDVGFYAYRRMEVENAAEVGAQAASKSWSNQASPLPATQNDEPQMNNAITTAIQSTSLGAAVSLVSGYPTEGDYCLNASNVLQCVGSLSSPPPASCSATGQQPNCAAAGNANASPGDYIQVQVTYPYQPLFPGVSVMGILGISSITKTTWMRMG
jgi:Flp pilus assembly protein TadG